jgi:signal peptidase I
MSVLDHKKIVEDALSGKSTDKTGKKKKPAWREWLDAGVFAIVAATLIRTFVFEAYTIPTGSMEGSMLVNDYLFVSKLSYGPRIPMTPLAVPLVHNTMPLTGAKSYTEAVQWGYHRIPGFGHVERNDVVVFNYPAGDTVMAQRPADDYYSALRSEYNGDREEMKARYTIITRPVDKKENYIKRCVGMPGDVLEVKDAVLYINGQPATAFPHMKLWYIIRPKGMVAVPTEINDIEIELVDQSLPNVYFLENNQVAELQKTPNLYEITPYIFPKGMVTESGVFPHDTVNFKFNRDNFGPITLPKAGATVQLNPQNIALYRRVIRNYELNKLDEKDGKIFINDKEATSYTFKMDYYWMMGDNRDNSLDSRYWGYVPADHVVGKAWFVWFSYSKKGISDGIRWKRLFHSVHSLEK